MLKNIKLCTSNLSTIPDDDLAEYAVSHEYYTDVHKPFGVENDF